ncbi:MAG: hypothetical protein HY721_34175 [Planctomycetes bacterium]|nr:hypothetical protein [Planctomycetota bacterium]
MTTSRTRAGVCLWAALAGALSISGGARAANRFFIPDVTLPAGASGQDVLIRCEHDVTLRGYSLSIRYDPRALRVAALSADGTSVGQPDFWADASQEGEIAVGVALDLTPPITGYLAPASDHTLARVTLDVLGRAGTQASLDFVDGLGRFQPVRNVIVDESGFSVIPALDGGTIAIAGPGAEIPPVADAGPDQVVPEVSRVTLDGSGSRSSDGATLSYRWTQVAGPPAQEVAGEEASALTFTAPPVSGDSELVFRLEVTAAADGGSTLSAGDEAVVSVLDLDLREAVIAQTTAGKGQLIDGGARALVFQGELTWASDLEEAFWTRVRFSPSGPADESRLTDGASLYVDSNGNGAFDLGDKRLGDEVLIAGDDRPFEVRFAEPLRAGTPLRFFLVVDVAPARAAAMILPAALAACLLAAGRRRRSRGRPRRRLLRLALSSTFLLATALLPLACSGGGGGGGGRAAAGTRELRFEIRSSDDISIQGAKTGVAVQATGLPLQGPGVRL